MQRYFSRATDACFQQCKLTAAVLGAFALLVPPGVFADDSASARTGQAAANVAPTERAAELPTVTVSASQSEIKRISADTLDTRSLANVQSVLQDVPGVSYSRSGGLGGQIVMRGFNSNTPRTLLLVDGERFRGRNTLEFNLIDPNQIERIEVLRGPGSAFYGPDAMVGVINVITRRAKGDVNGPLTFTPLLRALEYNSASDMKSIRLEGQAVGNGLDALVGVSYRTAGNFSSPEGSVPNSDFTVGQFDLRAGYQLQPGHRLELTLKAADTESGRAGGIGGVPGAPLVLQREDPLRERYARLAYSGRQEDWGLEQINASLYVRSLYSRLTTENRTQNNRLTVSENIVDGPVVYGGKLSALMPLGPHMLTFGTDFFHEVRKGAQSGSGVTTLSTGKTVIAPVSQNSPDAQQTNIGLFAQLDYVFSDAWSAKLGGRADYVKSRTETSPIISPVLQSAYERNRERTDRPLTGQFSLAYRWNDNLTLWTGAGTSFRVPSTIESFGSSRQGTGYNVPNPELRPEEGKTLEIGTRYSGAGKRLDITLFDSRYTDFIVGAPITFNGLASFQNQNVGSARVRGIEVDGGWQIARTVQAYFDLAYLHGTDAQTNQPLSYLPPLNGRLGLRADLGGNGQFEPIVRWARGKHDFNTTAERPTSGYAVLDLYWSKDMGRWLNRDGRTVLSVGISNVFDRTYRLATTVEDIRYPISMTNPLLETGRAFSVSLKSDF